MCFELSLGSGKDISKVELTTLLYLWLQLVPVHVGIAQIRGVLALTFMLFFHFLRLNIEFCDMLLDTGRIVKNEQACAGQVIEHRCLTMEVGQIEGDILE